MNIICLISLTLNVILLSIIVLFLACKRNIFSKDEIVDQESFLDFFGVGKS